MERPKSPWWHSHLDPEERRRVMSDLAISRQPHWAFRFGVMLTLSIIVAVMGLSANSAAVVIGAMLLAPLMQPVLAVAACIPMALFRMGWRSLVRVIVSSLWGIVLSYVLAKLFINDNDSLPTEVTSRTAPDVRDLVVALGAGAAGAYASVRKDASSALPGVAVAVALVPPLGTVGIALEAGETAFARGAFLLYVTNLVAIVLAGVIVFFVTGFVPPSRLRLTYRRTMLVALIVAVAVIAIAIPLFRASQAAVEESGQRVEAAAIVDSWLGPIQTSGGPSIQFSSDRIRVVVTSFEQPPDSDALISALKNRFGDEFNVSVEWDRIEQATTTTTTPPSTTVVTDEERRLAAVIAVVDAWLLAGSPDDSTHQRDTVSIDTSTVRVDASGVGSPPPVTDLEERLAASLGVEFDVRLTWLARETVDETEPTPRDILAAQIEVLVEAWAAEADVDVRFVEFDGERAAAEVIGVDQPDAEPLIAQVDALTGANRSIDVYFVRRFEISTTTTTTTTTSIPVAVLGETDQSVSTTSTPAGQAAPTTTTEPGSATTTTQPAPNTTQAP